MPPPLKCGIVYKLLALCYYVHTHTQTHTHTHPWKAESSAKCLPCARALDRSSYAPASSLSTSRTACNHQHKAARHWKRPSPHKACIVAHALHNITFITACYSVRIPLNVCTSNNRTQIPDLTCFCSKGTGIASRMTTQSFLHNLFRSGQKHTLSVAARSMTTQPRSRLSATTTPTTCSTTLASSTLACRKTHAHKVHTLTSTVIHTPAQTRFTGTST